MCANQNTYKTHCFRGHEFTPENTYMNNGKHRVCKTCQKITKAKNIDKIRESARNHYHRNKVRISAERKRTWKDKIQTVKIQVLTYYGNGKLECVCCNEKTLEFLNIDHINGREKGDRKRGIHIYEYLKWNNFPTGFQTLCFNCNLGRSLNHGICPHKALEIESKEATKCLN